MGESRLHSEGWRDAANAGFSLTLARDLEGLARYLDHTPRVFDLGPQKVAVAFEIAVDLPPRGTVGGIDIRPREPLLLIIEPTRYPFVAPQVRSDRRDFPADSLPHLNPVASGDPPYLCLHRGSINDYFASASLIDIVERARRWFSDAAAGELIPPGDYFEPTRIDTYTHHFTANLALFDQATNRYPRERKVGTHAFYLARVLSPDGYAVRLERVLEQGAKKEDGAFREIAAARSETIGGSPALGIASWNPEFVDDRYLVELPRTAEELFVWASRRRIGLEAGIHSAIHRFGWDNLLGTGSKSGHILVSLGILRPRPVLGANSNREWLTFLVTVEKPGDSKSVPCASRVEIMVHHQPLSMHAAAKLSRSVEGRRPKVLIFGCGALGSRLALHLGRGGDTDLGLCDNAVLAPHHFVRHASSAIFDGYAKTHAVNLELFCTFRAEGDQPRINRIPSNAIDLILAPEHVADYDLAIDATASTSVAHALAATVAWPSKCRVVRTEIADEGRLGVTLVEGVNREPRLDDLRAHLYDLGRTNVHVQAWLLRFREQLERGRGPVLEEVELGMGCSSDTTRLDDATVALHAAFTARLLRSRNIPATEGLVVLSVADEDGSLASVREVMPAFLRAIIGNNQGWDVRVSQGAHRDMIRFARMAHPNETGGLLLGMVQRKQRVIHVTGVLGPSPDSRGSPSGFRRGREGYPESLQEVARQTARIIGYVGEWHVHPNSSPSPSSVDREAVLRIREELPDRSVPALCVILGGADRLGGWLQA